MQKISLANMRIGTRLTVGFVTILSLIVVTAVLDASMKSAADQATDDMVAQYQKNIVAHGISADIDSIRLRIWGILAAKDPTVIAGLKTELADIQASYRAKVDQLKASATTATGKQALVDLDEALAATREVNNEVLELATGGQAAQATALFATAGNQRRNGVHAATAKLISWREQRVAETRTAKERIQARMRWLLLGAGFSVLVLSVLIAISLTRSVTRPLAASERLLKSISKGDLTVEVPTALLSRQDEAGQLAGTMAGLTKALQSLVLDVLNGIGTLGATAEGLKVISQRLTHGAKLTSERTQTVATAAEESSTNTVSVAASIEQASTNLTSVASAAEEMSATVGEIAANAEKARMVSEQAVGEARSMTGIMEQLGQAAREIGKVTETITDISAQTNLLALNATIEAARAGAAGKGFAVVATEIKDLARQTGTATEDIKTKIASVQTSAGEAIANIEKITGVSKDVGAFVTSIAGAIEEQAAVTKDVASNVAQASAGIKDATERVAQTAAVSKSMAEDILRVSLEGKAMDRNSAIVDSDIGGLRAVTGRLQEIASRFQVSRNLTDFGAIKKGHIMWRGKLLDLFEGTVKLSEEEAKNHRGCAFHAWYESAEGQRLRGLPIYEQIGAHHRAFHGLVGEIVRLWTTGREDEAIAQYGKLLSHTGELFVLLDELSHAAVKVAA
jgi:methyl-accepting chemotaxis protein